MIWNRWRRPRPITGPELLDAALAIGKHLPTESVKVALGEDALTWTLRKSDLRSVAERLAQDDLDDDWEDEVDDVDAEHYEVVIDYEVVESEGTMLTWDPKSGDNNAAWPVAWLFAVRLTEAIGAAQVEVSASYLLERPTLPSPLTALPLIAMRASCVLPTGCPFPTTIGRRASTAALDAAIALYDGWCIVGVQRDPAIEEPQASDLHSIACVARVAKCVEPSPDNRFVLLVGAERVRLDQISAQPAGSLMASGSVLSDAAPDERIPRLLLDAADQLMQLTIASDNMADDALEILQRLPPARLADAALEIFAGMLDQERRVEALQEIDPSERLMLVVDTLSDTVTAIQDALDEHGDLQEARLAMLESSG